MKKALLGIICFFSFLTVLAQQSGHDQTFTRADTLRGMLSPLRSCYDINYYHLDIRVDIGNTSISGSNLFRFTATEDFKRLQFDLFDNYEIEKILYKNQSLEFTAEYDAVFIEFPETIKKGSIDEFQVFYSGSPVIARRAPWDGGFVFSEDDNKAPWVGVACQGLGASSWWPNKDHQSDEVDSILISVTVPRGLQDVSNGRLRSKEAMADGATRFNWFVSYPINNYDVTLYIGDFTHFSDEFKGANGLLILDYYVLRENLAKAKTHFEDVKRMLSCFEDWFGPYPFYRDGYKLVDAPYLGMEHQSAIAYGNGYKKGYEGKDLSGTGKGLTWDFIIVNESGHEWFGNNITAKDIADMWIHEAFTSYSESLFVECNAGKNAALQYIVGLRKNIRNDKAIVGPYNVNKEGSGDMYYKGSNVLHSIRTIIGNDETWKAILRGLNRDLGLKTTTTAEIISYINTHSGKNFSNVFEQYLQHKNIPELKLKVTSGNQLTYWWEADVKSFDMPARIQFSNDNNWIEIYPTTSPKTIKFKGKASDIKVDKENFYIKSSITSSKKTAL